MRKKKQKEVYAYNEEDFKAYRWCINNKIYISPFCKENFVSWYIDIEINGRVNRSPGYFNEKKLWEKIFEYYKYYYKKYAKEI